MYKAKIKQLQESHKILNKQIDDMERNHPHVEEARLSELKKKKLLIKDEIARLNKLQWDHDHESVDLGD
jgi:hypothetical protein